MDIAANIVLYAYAGANAKPDSATSTSAPVEAK
jgi:hypothetical protein